MQPKQEEDSDFFPIVRFPQVTKKAEGGKARVTGETVQRKGEKKLCLQSKQRESARKKNKGEYYTECGVCASRSQDEECVFSPAAPAAHFLQGRVSRFGITMTSGGILRRYLTCK